MLDTDLARNVMNRSIMGAFNPVALAMTRSEITDFILEFHEEIRKSIPDHLVREEDLLTKIIKLLTLWLPVTITHLDDLKSVKLRDIVPMPSKFYPGGVRPDGTRLPNIWLNRQVTRDHLILAI